ncbi:LysM peptidoglycan-binding domain-containing protein [Yoonia sp. 208BN28-4]|uniref:LysM peptidoglycan-binding domain-containing protein n=1 Tax=Yoonia sp. 208BN28-4 TaxID=3126505 RepID=UPI003095EB86
MNAAGPITETRKGAALPWIIAVGAMTFAVGMTGAMFVMQNRQASQTEMMAAMMMQMQQQQQDATVTRNASAALLTVPTAPAAAPAPAPVPVAAPVVATAAIPSASAAIANRADPAVALTDTRTQEEKVAEAVAAANANKVRMLTEGIVAGLYDVTNEQDASGSGTRIALASRNAPSAVVALEELLTEAIASGEIELPDSVANADGVVDTQTMLFDLVQRSLEGGSDAEIAAAAELRRRAFEASTAQSEVVGGERYYTVESGDSLAYIALQFYGSTNAYGRIYEANREIIPAPDKIQIGQRLLIPNV